MSFIVSNFGNVALSNVSLTDDLNAVFGAGNYSISSAPTVTTPPATGTVTVNNNFNGSGGNTNLLTGGTLPVGESVTIAVSIAVTNVINAGSYTNQATAGGNGPSGTPTTDLTDSGTNPDNDGDGDPSENNGGPDEDVANCPSTASNESCDDDATVFGLTVNPVIGVAKDATVSPNGSGGFTVVFDFVIENFSAEVLNSLQLVDSLVSFYDNTNLTAANINITGGTLGGATNFDGNANQNVLATNQSLAANTSGTVQVTLTNVVPNAGVTLLTNQATGSGVGANSGTTATDTSTSGVNPDPNDDGTPDEQDVTPVPFGTIVSGFVFFDNGLGGGTANDGSRNGLELGVPNVTLQALCDNVACPGAGTITTGTNGEYSLLIPVGVNEVTLTETNRPATLSTGADLGAATGSYNLNADTITLDLTAGGNLTGINFGDVSTNQFGNSNASSVACGESALYGHTFRAESRGSVSFAAAHNTTQALTPTAWTNTLYRDNNCNGTIDGADAVIASGIDVDVDSNTALPQQVCLLVEVNTPDCSQAGSKDNLDVTATFTYSGNAVAENIAGTSVDLVLQDITSVVSKGIGYLTLTKSATNLDDGVANDDGSQAKPGERLEYSVTFTNPGSGPVTEIVVEDKTPAYTVLDQAAVCPTLPASTGLTNCTVTPTVAGSSADNIAWTFDGALAAGQAVTITFTVRIDE